MSNNCDTQTRITNWNAFNNENIIEIQCKTVQPLPANKEQHNIHCGLVNCRSIVNKTQAIQDKIGNCKLNICALMETWIKPEDNITHTAICPPGYKAISVPRTNKTGRGMAIIHCNDFTVNHHKTYDFTSMECSSFTIKQSADSKPINMFTVYRPLDTSVINFLEDLATVLEDNINHTGEIILLGDYNIKVNDDQCMDSINLSDFLDSFGLHNSITFPTHRLQNTLDLVITRQDRNLIRNCKQDTLFSDHYLITFDITTSLPKDNRTTISFRKIKDMDFTNFRCHIVRGFTNADLKSLSVNETVNLYNTTLQEAIDKFASIKVKSVNPRKKIPWFSTNICHEIQHCRKLERKWKLNKSDQQAYMEFYRQRRKVHNPMTLAERIFYRNKLQDNRNDFKAIYCICNGLLGCTRDLPLPPCESEQELADRFANFFSSKIKKIHSILDETSKSLVEEGLQVPSEKQTNHRLECFALVSENEVTSLINKSPNKACELDPIPTDLLKQVLEETTPVTQSIINKSPQQGVFPDDMKEAFLRPLLKSSKLELQDQNYRPVSNLSFCSKTIERVAANQIVDYIEKNNLMEPNQSAYRRNHSTETTLLKAKSDILLALDKQHITCLYILDLSAAYDTID